MLHFDDERTALGLSKIRLVAGYLALANFYLNGQVNELPDAEAVLRDALNDLEAPLNATVERLLGVSHAKQ